MYSSVYLLVKAMAPHSITLAWKIPRMEEPGRLQSMGLRRVRHEQLHFHFSLSCIGEGNGNPLVFLPGESQGQGSLVGCCPWVCRVGHDWSDLACMCALEKEMATHSSVLAWRIPGTGELGGLPSMGLHRIRHNWSDLAAAAVAAVSINEWMDKEDISWNINHKTNETLPFVKYGWTQKVLC